MDFVEICNICARKAIIEAAKRIINSDKVHHSYSDLNFGDTSFGTQCISPKAYVKLLMYDWHIFCVVTIISFAHFYL